MGRWFVDRSEYRSKQLSVTRLYFNSIQLHSYLVWRLRWHRIFRMCGWPWRAKKIYGTSCLGALDELGAIWQLKLWRELHCEGVCPYKQTDKWELTFMDKQESIKVASFWLSRLPSARLFWRHIFLWGEKRSWNWSEWMERIPNKAKPQK